MIPQPVTPDTDPGSLAARWQIDLRLAIKIVQMVRRLPFTLQLISGHRSCEHQQRLAREGRPAAPCDVSTHVSCPATGADVWPSVAVTDVVKATLGEAATAQGIRWGGGSSPDPRTGIPSDWNHLDLGPRKC